MCNIRRVINIYRESRNRVQYINFDITRGGTDLGGGPNATTLYDPGIDYLPDRGQAKKVVVQ